MSAAPVFDWLVPSEAEKLAAAWRGLAARAEPNPFADPDFLLPAFQFLAPRGLRLAALWSDARRERLIAVAAIRPGISPVSLAQVWMHELAALPAIMVDRESATDAVAALKVVAKGRGAGLLIPAVELSSALGQALATAAAEPIDPTRRASLSCGPASDFGAQLPAKRRKEWARQRRRLEDGGELTFARGGDGLEAFLTLEAAGWKGQRGTALSQNAASAGFVRAMIGAFAARQAVEIATLQQGDAVIAGGVVLKSGRRGFYWKTAFDERHAALSPGVQFTLQLSGALEKTPEFDLVDSCAIADHPMIDRLWPDRLELADFALPLGAEAGFAFRTARNNLEWGRALKAAAKRALKR